LDEASRFFLDFFSVFFGFQGEIDGCFQQMGVSQVEKNGSFLV